MKALMMTRLIFSLLAALALVSMPVLIMAEDGTTSSGRTTAAEQLTARAQAAQSLRDDLKTDRDGAKQAITDFKAATTATRLAKAKEMATKLIDVRIKAVEKLSDNGNTQKCSTAAKADVKTVLDEVSARLAADKTSVATMTTVDQVKALIQQDIVGKNHVFVALLPAVRGMCVADNLMTLIDGKLTTLVNQLKTQGADTTTVEKDLSDAKTAAKSAYDAYKNVANNLSSTTYKTDLAAAKDLLKTAKTDLTKAKEDLGKLKDSIEPSSGTETPSTSTE